MKRTFSYYGIVLAVLYFTILALPSTLPAAATSLKVLCSTFPMYQITRNLVSGRDSVRVELMIPAQLGCPHDYVLTPQDMQKLAKADVLVVNGLGMEEFLGAPVAKANPRLRLIDSSKGIKETLAYTGDHGEAKPTTMAIITSPRPCRPRRAMSLNSTAITTRLRGLIPTSLPVPAWWPNLL